MLIYRTPNIGEEAGRSMETDRRTRAEQRVLASIMARGDCIRHCADLQAGEFSHDLHGSIFDALMRLIEAHEPINARSVFAAMSYPHDGWASCLAYLAALEGMEVLPSHVGYYACIMRTEK
jgi:replicative DNA helicase